MQRQILFDAFGVPEGIWGSVGGRLMGALNRPINELTVDLLDVQPRDRVLEIGYGPGTALALVGARASEGLVAGVDPSAVMARQAYRRNLPLMRRGRLRLTLGRSDRLPFGAAQFDRVFTVNTIYFWPTPRNDLAELRRVTKPGGHMALTFRGKRGPSGAFSVRTIFGTEYRVEQVAAMLTAVGFRDVETTVRKLPFMTAVCLVACA